MKLKATILYQIKANHPDMQYIKDWKPGKVYEYTDIYIFDNNLFFDVRTCKEYAKRDLKLVAGGGYNSDHIENYSFKFETL